MDPAQMQQAYQQYFYYIVIAGIVIGLVLGAVPLFLAIRRNKRRLGWIAFLVCGVTGAFSPLGALIAAIIFVVIVLKGKKAEPQAPADGPSA